MTHPTTATPRHFSGELTAITLGCGLGLHRIEAHLRDHDGAQHVVYLAYGRGDAAARYAQAQYDRLSVGTWYHGSATLCRRTNGLTEWGGHVTPLEVCPRRHRFSAATQAATA